MKWLAHFSLSAAPFSKEVEDAELWVPTTRRRIVDELVAASHDRGHVLLTGEPGVGKTCVLRALRHRLPHDGFRLTYCHNATLGRRDFYRHVCLALGLAPKATAAAVFYAIHEHVHQLSTERVHPIFLLDEAHPLHQDVLEHLHILANHEWDAKALLSLVLVGLPEMRDRLALHKNRSFWSRVHTRVNLGDATAADTAEYVAYRMKRVGADREVFSSDALSLLHEASRGHLRDLDRLATDALKLACRKRVRIVDRDLVTRVQRADADDDS
jgi:general secretion pathway protein A